MTLCTATTKAGNPCKNHAKGSETLCSSHLGATGAPIGNQNARKHGFYSTILSNQEKADIASHAAEMTTADELAYNRILIRRAGEYLLNEEITLAQFTNVCNLIQNGSRVILQLIQQSEAAANIWDDVLDELSVTLGLRL